MSQHSGKSELVMGGKLALVAVAMFGFGFLLVPLYDIFCEITGLGGKTNTEAAQVAQAPDTNRLITVEFLATTNSYAPWEFRPTVATMQVHPGQLYNTSYYAENLTPRELTATATPSVSPGAASKHFKKVECFCFTQQDFLPNEGRDMPVQFMIDPNLPDYIDRVTLSYTFFQNSKVATN